MGSNDFPHTDRSRLRRIPDRGSHSREEVYSILDAGLVCQVGVVLDEDQQVCGILTKLDLIEYLTKTPVV